MLSSTQGQIGQAIRQRAQLRRGPEVAGWGQQLSLNDRLMLLHSNALALRDQTALPAATHMPAATPLLPGLPDLPAMPTLAALRSPHGLPGRPWPGAAAAPGTAVSNGNGHAAVGGRQARPGTQPDYRPVSAGMAITPTVSVVVPVMNEAANLAHVFATLPEWIDQVVLVDGRSTDDTVAVARALRPDVTVVLQGGIGKGDALLAGFAACTSDIIVAMDGDGSTDGREIIRFVSTLVCGADFAKGSRFASAGRSDDITAIRRYGNRALNLLVNALYGTKYSDLCYGYNAFWARHLPKLALDCPGFEVEALMGIRAAKARLRIHEVPSHERPREHGSSNLHAVRDGLRILRLIVRERRAGSWARSPKPFLAPALATVDGGTR